MNSLELMSLKNTRFGDLEFDSREVVTFPDGLIGYPGETGFLLISTSTTSSFIWLQSIHSATLAFLLTDPRIYVQDYAPSVQSEEGEQLFTTVNIPHGHPELMTLNLAGPISIDVPRRTGKQIVLDHEAYTTKYRVFAEGMQISERSAA